MGEAPLNEFLREGLSKERLVHLRTKSKDANIVLIGFMGAGKSAVGRRLSRALGRYFVDADAVIEARAGCSIPELFRQRGESEFRRQESEVIRQLAKLRRSVIATGGGAVMREENWEALSRNGILVWLRAPLDVLMARAEGVDRPLMARGREALTALYEQREPLYARAHLSVDTEERSPLAVVEHLRETLQAAGLLAPDDAGQTKRLSVDLGERSYPIWIGDGLLPRLGEFVGPVLRGTRCLVVTQPHLHRLYGDVVTDSLQAVGFSTHMCTIPDGEASKNLRTVEAIYEAALQAGLDRGSAIIALGGGVVGDAAGFAAATYMRGIAFIQVPTTLLAQVDASVGGKVGVNLAAGKNLIGAFHQPKGVVIDMNTLLSLPQRQLLAGLAEVAKHGFIADPSLIERLSGRRTAVLDRDRDELVYCVQRSCEIKADIVRQDETEAGVRAWLNFGHTFAHGLEAASSYDRWVHGEAVSIGMAAALRLSAKMGWLDEDDVGRAEDVLTGLGLPHRAEGVDPEHVWKAMHRDKKARDGQLHFVLLRGFGSPVLTADVSEEHIRSVLDAICLSRDR